MRMIAFDVGAQRTGVAVSDATQTLASPFRVLRGVHVLHEALAIIRDLEAEDGVEAIVIGLPLHLDGTPTGQTPRARAFAGALGSRLSLPVHLQDERLTSVDAEERLAATDRDWRSRKQKLDAAAAAIILQDFLDARARARGLAGAD